MWDAVAVRDTVTPGVGRKQGLTPLSRLSGRSVARRRVRDGEGGPRTGTTPDAARTSVRSGSRCPQEIGVVLETEQLLRLGCRALGQFHRSLLEGVPPLRETGTVCLDSPLPHEGCDKTYLYTSERFCTVRSFGPVHSSLAYRLVPTVTSSMALLDAPCPLPVQTVGGKRRGGSDRVLLPMIQEKDIPCSDCGTDLVERSVRARELPVSTDLQGHVTIVVCPSCGARYYPERTVTRLSDSPSDARSRGD